MMPLSLPEIIGITNARTRGPLAPSRPIKGFSTDSRTLQPGEVFIALAGPNFNGHKFITPAISQGACAVITVKPPRNIARQHRHIPILCVKNPLDALGQLAGYYRTKLNIPIIAVTGSNGKTTTKEMIYHILSAKYHGIKSPKNYNNFIGVPLTILAIRPHHKFAVLELATNHPGEISYLARIARPNIGLITNVSATHLEGLGSINGVAREKWSLFEHLAADGTAIFNIDNQWLKKMPQYAENISKGVTFGRSQRADIYGKNLNYAPRNIRFKINNRCLCKLSLTGGWNMENALAALATASTLDVTLPSAINRLRSFTSPAMRMETRVIRGTTLINDAYNANPHSVALAIDELAQLSTPGRKILILGDMYELGKYSRKFHTALGNQLRRTDIDTLLAVGQAVKHTVAQLHKLNARQTLFHFYSSSMAGSFLKNYMQPRDIVLLKGSRTMELEKVLESLSEERT